MCDSAKQLSVALAQVFNDKTFEVECSDRILLLIYERTCCELIFGLAFAGCGYMLLFCSLAAAATWCCSKLTHSKSLWNFTLHALVQSKIFCFACLLAIGRRYSNGCTWGIKAVWLWLTRSHHSNKFDFLNFIAFRQTGFYNNDWFVRCCRFHGRRNNYERKTIFHFFKLKKSWHRLNDVFLRSSKVGFSAVFLRSIFWINCCLQDVELRQRFLLKKAIGLRVKDFAGKAAQR